MKKHRYLALLGLSLIVLGIVTQPVMATFSLNRFDSTGYNHVVENSATSFSQVDANQNTGKMTGFGSSGFFSYPSTLVLEMGYVFNAPEDGDFRVTIVWSSSYCLTVWKYLIWWGQASIKVEYVLFSSTHQQLEAKTVLSKAASPSNTIVSGSESMGIANVYRFSYNLVEGTSYTVAVRLTLSVAGSSRICSATSTSSPAYIDVNQINIRN